MTTAWFSKDIKFLFHQLSELNICKIKTNFSLHCKQQKTYSITLNKLQCPNQTNIIVLVNMASNMLFRHN